MLYESLYMLVLFVVKVYCCAEASLKQQLEIEKVLGRLKIPLKRGRSSNCLLKPEDGPVVGAIADDPRMPEHFQEELSMQIESLTVNHPF